MKTDFKVHLKDDLYSIYGIIPKVSKSRLESKKSPVPDVFGQKSTSYFRVRSKNRLFLQFYTTQKTYPDKDRYKAKKKLSDMESLNLNDQNISSLE